jgi:hypothetical protein
MERNLLRRLETCFPVLDPELRARVREEGLDVYLQDDRQSWLLQSDGSWVRARVERATRPRNAQRELLEKLCPSVDPELQADAAEGAGLVLEVRADERMLREPARREDEVEGSGSAA